MYKYLCTYSKYMAQWLGNLVGNSKKNYFINLLIDDSSLMFRGRILQNEGAVTSKALSPYFL